MNIKTIATIILIISIGIYCLALFLVFRQTFRRSSDLKASSPEAEWPRFSENEKRLHKIVQSPLIDGNELPDEKDEEKHG
jgi:hypothetical protein